MELLHEQVLKVCGDKRLIEKEDRILVGVSGGSDSTALLHVLNDLKSTLGIKLVVAHFHHGLRAETADRDASFVRRLSLDLGLPYVEERGDVAAYQKESGLSRQEAARHLRLQFLERVRRSSDLRKIALGHTRDDQVEELMMRLIRGVGPDALAGMSIVRDEVIIRPFLHIPKSSILRFLKERGLNFMEDESNRDIRYLRNRVRHQVLPLLRAVNPRVDQALHRLSLLAEEDRSYWTQAETNLWLKLVIYESEGLVVLNRAGLREQHGALASRLVRGAVCKLKGASRSLNFGHVQAVLEAVKGNRSNLHMDFPLGVSVDIAYGEVVFSLRDRFKAFNLTLERPGTLVINEIQSRLKVEQAAFSSGCELDCGPWEALIDAKSIHWPLAVRTMVPGDRMEPLSLGFSKKLKDIFMDRKIARWKRTLLPILESKGDIVWVAGVGLSQAVKVNPQTREILHLAYEGPLKAA
jgi:tRNA(Ile)-lysidine synthase